MAPKQQQQQRYSGPERRTIVEEKPGAWHFEKRISLDTIVAILGIALVIGGPFIVWGRAMEGRVLTLENIASQLEKKEAERIAEVRDQRALADRNYRELADALQRLQVSFAKLEVQLSVAQGARK